MHFARLSFLVEVQRLDGPLLFGLVAAGAPPGVAGMLGQRPSAAICADAGSGGVVSEGPRVSTTSLYRAHASVALADSKFEIHRSTVIEFVIHSRLQSAVHHGPGHVETSDCSFGEHALSFKNM